MKTLFLAVTWLLAGGVSWAQHIDRSERDPNFFPIAVWAQRPELAPAYKENGINMFINIYGGLDEEKMRELRNANMKVITHQNAYGLTQLREPLIYGWINGDEPDNAQRNKTKNNWDPCIDPADVIRDYKEIKRNDPGRPVYLNVGPGVAHTHWVGRGVCRGRTDMYKISNNGYLKGCDIASFYLYPVNSSEKEVQGKLWYMAKGIDSLRAWSNRQKPAWCWIETTRISDNAVKGPTPKEVRAEVWMALIHGAKGFGYFCHSFAGETVDDALLQDREMIRMVRSINEQVTALAPVLNGPDTRGYARVRSDDPNVPVDILTKRDKKINYIFAAAMRDQTTSATFYVKSGKTVEVLGENRIINIKRGKFTDAFSAYGVHLYRITR